MKRFPVALVVAALAGCASAPVPFTLLDSDNKAYFGAFDPNEQRMEVHIGAKAFAGYYILAGGTIRTTDLSPGFRRFPRDSFSTTSSNTGKATLAAADGERLSCDFMLDPPHSVGRCESRSGKVYELVDR